ncbi:hypothetical protein ABZP36_030422 [Zizania latifolia]
MAERLLHGVMDVKILEANLQPVASDHGQPKTAASSANQKASRTMLSSLIMRLQFIFKCQRSDNSTDQGRQHAGAGKRLVYATIGIDAARVGRTRAADQPQWKEEPLHVYCAHNASNVVFTVVRAVDVGDPESGTGATAEKVIGCAYLPADDVAGGQQVDRWLPLFDDKRRPLEGLEKIHVQLNFSDVSADPASRWGKGVGYPPTPYTGMPRAFFGQHRGCKLTLYQDAHVVPPLSGSKCWEDIFDAVANARRLVYIAGWSVSTDVALVRDPRRPAQTLGKLLKAKAGERVVVLMLVWDDQASAGLDPARRDGRMAGHGEDMASYFRGTGVHCVMCPRDAVFTHHQKAVVADGTRGLVAFLGGIDLCGGSPASPARRSPRAARESPDEAERCGLVTGSAGDAVDRSIQDAYIHAIRRAMRFIYIESQCFVGSSYGWHRDVATANNNNAVDAAAALHLIPKELSLKLASKIRAGDSFRVYVVIPMWPEGMPESATVQAILDWQRRTMEMMYKDVAAALADRGSTQNPRDYLNFFCLGNRESHVTGEHAPPERPELGSDYMRAQQARRFKINVNANIMIVDDDYIIVGSANINQRSMDGGRDTELAIGAYQPAHLDTPSAWPRGQVHQFRLALWREHLGQAPFLAAGSDLIYPASAPCAIRVNQAARQHWDMYASGTFQGNLPGHLMTYPIDVGNSGELQETVRFFPDTKASVFGCSSAPDLPPVLTA